MSLTGKVTGMLAGVGMKALGESRYEFHPDYAPGWGEQASLLKPPAAYGLEEFESFDLRLDTGESVTAWYKPASPGYATVAYCHGNAGALDMRRHQLKALADLGFGLMIATYPGFKHEREHAKLFPSEAGCLRTGHALVRELVLQKEVEPENLVLVGESLGGAVVLRTAYDLEQPHNFLDKDPVPVGSVIAINTFDSLVKRGMETHPDLPLHTFMQNRFETDSFIGKLNTPALLMHGEQDTFTPPVHSERLAALGGENIQLAIIPGVSHALMKSDGGDAFDHEQLARVVNCAQQFLYDKGLYPDPAPVSVREYFRNGRTRAAE